MEARDYTREYIADTNAHVCACDVESNDEDIGEVFGFDRICNPILWPFLLRTGYIDQSNRYAPFAVFCAVDT